MSKRFKGKTCVYCCTSLAESGDHVFAREFFLREHRAGLPKVPACLQCNRDKSELEHYLTAVLPFGGRHRDARLTLEGMVPDRLAKNARLYRLLQQGRDGIWVPDAAGLQVPTMTIPFDGEKLERLFGLIARGLTWHHWQTLLGSDCTVQVLSLTKAGERFFEPYLRMRANVRVDETLAGGAVSYEGAQGTDNPQVTAWRISLYGGVLLADGESRETCSKMGIFTGPTRIFESAERKAKWLSGRGGQG